MSEKLKPCPFCGSKPIIIKVGNNFTRKKSVRIKCQSCRIERTTGAIRYNIEWCLEEAIKAWNTRAVSHE